MDVMQALGLLIAAVASEQRARQWIGKCALCAAGRSAYVKVHTIDDNLKPAVDIRLPLS